MTLSDDSPLLESMPLSTRIILHQFIESITKMCQQVPRARETFHVTKTLLFNLESSLYKQSIEHIDNLLFNIHNQEQVIEEMRGIMKTVCFGYTDDPTIGAVQDALSRMQGLFFVLEDEIVSWIEGIPRRDDEDKRMTRREAPCR